MTATNSQQFRRRHSSVHPIPLPRRQGHFHSGNSAHHGKPTDIPTVSRSLATRRFSEGESRRLKDLLICHSCGKAYKHISSLAKHLWEHTPEWTMTKKLLISKHQQVQLLEAASILVGMNKPGAIFEDHLPPVTSSPFSQSLPQYSLEDGHEILHMAEKQVLSSYAPMPGCMGGYIDVPSKHLDKESLDEEGDGMGNVVDEDEEILGKMD